jgi:hypothetical protein
MGQQMQENVYEKILKGKKYKLGGSGYKISSK